MDQRKTRGSLAAATAFDDLEVDLDSVPEPLAMSAGVKMKPKPKRASKPAEKRKWRFIDLPFKDNEEAKQLGARWNPDARLWYIPKGVARKHFRWPDKEISATLQSKLDDIDRAKAAAEEALIKPLLKPYRPKDPDAYRASRKMTRDMNLRFDFMMASDS